MLEGHKGIAALPDKGWAQLLLRLLQLQLLRGNLHAGRKRAPEVVGSLTTQKLRASALLVVKNSTPHYYRD